MWKILWLDDEFANYDSTESLIREDIEQKLGDRAEIETFSNAAELIEVLDNFAADLIILDIMGFERVDDLGSKSADGVGFFKVDGKLAQMKIPVIVFSGNLGAPGTVIFDNYRNMFGARGWRMASKSEQGAQDKLYSCIIDALQSNPFGRYNFMIEIVRNRWIPGFKNDNELENTIRKIIEGQRTGQIDSMQLVNSMRTIIDSAFMGEKKKAGRRDIYIPSPLMKRLLHDPLANAHCNISNLNNLISGIINWKQEPSGARTWPNSDRQPSDDEFVISKDLMPVEVRYALQYFWNTSNVFSHEIGSSANLYKYIRGQEFEHEAKSSVLALIYNSFFLIMEWFYAINMRVLQNLKPNQSNLQIVS